MVIDVRNLWGRQALNSVNPALQTYNALDAVSSDGGELFGR